MVLKVEGICDTISDGMGYNIYTFPISSGSNGITKPFLKLSLMII